MLEEDAYSSDARKEGAAAVEGTFAETSSRPRGRQPRLIELRRRQRRSASTRGRWGWRRLRRLPRLRRRWP